MNNTKESTVAFIKAFGHLYCQIPVLANSVLLHLHLLSNFITSISTPATVTAKFRYFQLPHFCRHYTLPSTSNTWNFQNRSMDWPDGQLIKSTYRPSGDQSSIRYSVYKYFQLSTEGGYWGLWIYDSSQSSGTAEIINTSGLVWLWTATAVGAYNGRLATLSVPTGDGGNHIRRRHSTAEQRHQRICQD